MCEMFLSVYSVGMCVFCGFEVDVPRLFHGYVLEPDFHFQAKTLQRKKIQATPFRKGKVRSSSNCQKKLFEFVLPFIFLIKHTPLKTNVSLENQWLENVFPTKIVPF